MDKYVIGADIGGTSIKIGVILQDGTIVEKSSLPTYFSMNHENIFNLISEQIEKYLNKYQSNNSLGIGVGLPGLVNKDCISVGGSPNLPGINGFDFKKFTNKYNLPISADNDGNNATRAELLFGSLKESKNGVLLTLGTGIGAGIIINRSLYLGSGLFAGEIGHMTLDPNGRTCNCGSFGCFETYASATGVINTMKNYIKKYPDSIVTPQKLSDNGAKAVFDAAIDNDPAAIEALKSTAYYIGVALANVVNILNIDTISIGGGLSPSFELLISEITNTMKQFTRTIAFSHVKIKKSTFLNDAGIIGSAALVLMKNE